MVISHRQGKFRLPFDPPSASFAEAVMLDNNVRRQN
jgi:hypothetical protein